MKGGQGELLARCKAGDQTAWAELYRAYAPIVARFVGRLVGGSDVVDDLVQQVFVEVFGSIRRYRGDGRVTTWLYGIARNVTFKHIRTETRRRRRREAFGRIQDLEPRHHAPDGEQQALLSQVDRAVQTLAPKHRVVWVMRELEGLSTEEVAEALGLRPGTVRSRLFKARRKVLEALEEPPAGGSAGEAGPVPKAVRGAEEVKP